MEREHESIQDMLEYFATWQFKGFIKTQRMRLTHGNIDKEQYIHSVIQAKNNLADDIAIIHM